MCSEPATLLEELDKAATRRACRPFVDGFSGTLQGSEQATIGAIKANSAQVAGALQSKLQPQLSAVV